MTIHLPAFRLGDIRGVFERDLDYEFAVQFAHAFVARFSLTGKVAVGRDMRPSSVILQDGLQKGLVASGIDVANLGLCTTELGYFASSSAGIEAVIIVTASHNSAEYNGFKCVLHGGTGIHFDNGLNDVMNLMLSNHRNPKTRKGSVTSEDYHARYIDFLRQRFKIDASAIGKIALNGLNGTASTLAADIAYQFELPTSWFRKEPGPFPKDGADPVNPRLQKQMFDFMQTEAFNLGVAWDGDCDRCVFFDGDGNYIPSYYMVGFLADHILSQTGPAPVVFDTKVCWNLQEVIERRNATPVPSKTGHAFMKENMKRSRAVYGGELSSHHYFGDFFYCDSGMYAWLKVVEMVSVSDVPMTELVAARRKQFKCIPEMSLKLTDTHLAVEALRSKYESSAIKVETDDGIAFDLSEWRFSIRESKTEPCVRVNLETKSSEDALLTNGSELLSVLAPFKDEDQDWLSGLEVG
jgi:phosphomannomutase